jgi:hypothetical protein
MFLDFYFSSSIVAWQWFDDLGNFFFQINMENVRKRKTQTSMENGECFHRKAKSFKKKLDLFSKMI